MATAVGSATAADRPSVHPERCVQLLGYDPATTDPDLTTIDTWRQRIHPDDYDRYQSLLNDHLAGLSPTFDCEIRLRHRQGHWIWVLDRGKVAEWDQADQPQRMSGTFTDITERKQAEEERQRDAAEILHNSLHDALTGLPNRTFLTQRLDLAIQRSRRYPQAQFAVLFLDLDHFKVINDSLGHLAGDEILVAVATILKKLVRATDMAARLGGDEFVLLLKDLNSLQKVEAVAERRLGELQRPFLVRGRAVFLNASLGIVTSLAHYQDLTEPLRVPTLPCIRPKPGAGAALSCLIYPCGSTSWIGSSLSRICGRPSTITNWCCIISPFCSWPRGRSVASRCWCAGTIPSGGCCCPSSSSPWPRKPG